MAATWIRGRRATQVALAATALVAFLVLASLALTVPAPFVLSDELRYAIAAASLAEGEGLRLRGESYGFGPAYPAVLAAILSFFPDRESAYPLFKVANALFFALTTVPVYLLARRLLPAWWSVGVAASAVAIPSSMYVSLVLTESLSYLTASVAILAIVLAVERPTTTRQLVVLGAIALAFLVRPQFAALFVAYLAAVVLTWMVVPGRRPRRELWPTLGALGLGLAGVTAAFLTESFGAYEDLRGGYEPLDVGRWVVYHLAGLELYLAVVPFAVSPIVLSRLLRDGRSGSVPAAAFASVFLTVNACLLLVAATFSSTEAGLDRLHDRYLFYVVPLWLVVLAVWLHGVLPRPLIAAASGAGLALVLPVVTPFSRLEGADGHEVDAVVTLLVGTIHAAVIDLSPDHLSGRRVLFLLVAGLVIAAVILPRRLGMWLAASVAGVLVFSAALAWRDAADAGRDADLLLGERRGWVDDAAGPDSTVTSLYIPSSCATSSLPSEALLLTEFFNRTVDRAVHIAARDESLLPSAEVRVGPGGTLVLDSGEPLEARYVVTFGRTKLHARRVATGTIVPLVLWKIEGPVRLRAGGPDLGREICPA